MSESVVAPQRTVALRVENVSVRFGGLVALDDVGFTVLQNDFAAVIGSNGAGKSTLLNILCGLLRRRVTGTVELFAANVRGRSASAIARLGVARSFQEPKLIESATVLENVLCGAHLTLPYRMPAQLLPVLTRRSNAAATNRAIELLEWARIAESAGAEVGGLPFGTRKIIDIVRAMMSNPQVLFLDEPTSGLHDEEQSKVVGLLHELRSMQTTTVVLVEHNMDVVRLLADHVVGMHAGQVLRTGDPDDVLDSPEYLGVLTGALVEENAG